MSDVERLADRHKRAFTVAIGNVLTHISDVLSGEADRLVAAGNMTGSKLSVETMFVAKEEGGVGDELTDVWVSVLTEAGELTGYQQAGFDLVNPYVVDVARREAGRLIIGLNTESRKAINQIITDSVRGRLTATEAATRIRLTAGLTSQQAVALTNYRDALQAAIEAEKPARASLGTRTVARDGLRSTAFRPTPPRRLLKPADVERLTNTYVRRQIAHRATVIARTEIMTAANLGIRESWNQAALDGLIDRQTTKRVWVVANDDRLCPQCAPMDGAVVEFNAPFVSTENQPAPVTADYPPLHVQCRCTTILEFV